MKIRLSSLLVWIVFLAGSVAADTPSSRDPAAWWPPHAPDDEARMVLDAVSAAGAYRTPALASKENETYADTAGDVAPFRHKEPFKRHFLLQMDYTGPGRAKPEPETLESVKIGFIGPIEPTVSVATGGRSHEEALGQSMLQGAQLAVEEANRRGGYLKRSIPFELVVRNDNGLWGASGNEIVDMAYREDVWAILGTIDGANTHIAIRVALKAEILMMNAGDTDPTLVETNIPWIMRCISDDRQQSYILLDYMYRKLDLQRIAVIRASNRYGRFGVREIRDGSRRLGRPIALEMAYPVGSEDYSLQLDRIRQADVDAVVHWGDAQDGARILNQMRIMGMEQPFYACDRCVSETFVDMAGDNAEGVMCTFPWNPSHDLPRFHGFAAAYRDRFGEEPETYAAHGFDGMSMLIWSIQVAGLNRAKIRDLLAYRTTPWPGVTGDIPLSATLDDGGEVYLAVRENGQWVFRSREELAIPRGYRPDHGQTSAEPVAAN